MACMACTPDPPGLQLVGILRLPPSLRHRIYEQVGLVPGPSDDVFDLNRKPCVTPLGFQGLLLSCRTIYEEASRVLYSSNRFAIRYSDRGSLRRLRNLRISSINVLSRLKIILAETSCHFPVDQRYGECCMEQEQCGADHDHNSPLDSSADALLAEWKLTATHLASAIAPGNLVLAIVCDVCPTYAGIQIARSVAALLLRFPRLQSCSLRWCKTPGPQLQELAYTTVLQTCQITPLPSSPAPGLLRAPPRSTSPAPSRLVNLPRELRLRVLEYTDLVTPWTEVTWSRQSRAFSMRSTYCEDLVGEGYECPTARHHGCQFSQCWHTSHAPTTGCFCRGMHSAYSWPASCRCWAPPQALFLVCRTLWLDAQAIFFSRNRFVIHDLHADPPYQFQKTPSEPDEPGYPFSTFAASIFLRDIVPTYCLGYLRFLELVLPPYMPENWPQEGDTALEDLTATLDWARDRLNVSRLTIRLVMADVNGYETWPRDFLIKGEGEAIIAGYMCIVSSLARLGPMDKFYAQLVSPWRWDKRTGRNEALAAEKEKELKERAEKLLMGDRYESLPSGAAEPPPSIWQHVYWAKW